MRTDQTVAALRYCVLLTTVARHAACIQGLSAQRRPGKSMHHHACVMSGNPRTTSKGEARVAFKTKKSTTAHLHPDAESPANRDNEASLGGVKRPLWSLGRPQPRAFGVSLDAGKAGRRADQRLQMAAVQRAPMPPRWFEHRQ